MGESKLERFLAALDLFRDPLLCAAMAGAVLGFLGVYVVLRRMVFVSAAVTQSAGLGVALSFYAEIHLGLHVEPLWGAAVAALLATLVLLVDTEQLRISREALLGLVFAATGGGAIVVGDRIAQEAHDIQAILFGTAVLVRPLDLWVVGACGAITLAVHALGWRGLTFSSFDPVAARVQGLPVRSLQAVVLVSIGLMVGVCARALGALPVFALTTLPALASLLAGLRLGPTCVLAAALGIASGFGGYLLAFFGELPVGASQSVVAATLVILALVARAATLALGNKNASAG